MGTKERKRLTNDDVKAKWKRVETNFNRRLRVLAAAALTLTELGEKWPSKLAVPIGREMRANVALAKKTIDTLLERLGAPLMDAPDPKRRPRRYTDLEVSSRGERGTRLNDGRPRSGCRTI